MRIGIIGCGFMGRMHLANWNRCPGAEVTAVCEQNLQVLKTINDPIGNIDGAAQVIDVSRIRLYTELGQMLKTERLDAVSITLPTYLHADASIQCLNAGVHVLCEKPMALDSHQSEGMIAAARASKKHLIIAHCIRFWPEYAAARQIIESGQYGRVVSAMFNRISTAPQWSSGGWLADPDHSGGMMLDLHIHDTDFILYLFGMPRTVCSCAGRSNRRITHIHTHYDYGDERVIVAEGSWAAARTFPFQMSFTIMLERATVVYNCNANPTLSVYVGEGRPFSPAVDAGDGYMHEIAWFAALLGGKNVRPVTSAEQSCDSVRLIEAERVSASEQRRITL